MYAAHFGLRELPFGITPDTGFFFAGASAQEALNTLLIAVTHGEGFIKVTGEVGTGKTLLCRKFMSSLDRSFQVAYIPNPMLEPRALMLALADELELPLEHDADRHRILKSISHGLMRLSHAGRRVVLCVDEAQALPVDSLEALRLLTNLETEKRKLLQIVLFGQPELDRILQRESIRQLAQRITFHCQLGALGRDDMAGYVAHRLEVAGHGGSHLFRPDAMRVLHAASRGIPRLVNILSHKALMLSYGEGCSQVYARHVRAAAHDTLATRRSVLRRWWLVAGAAMAVVTGTVWAYFQ
jgi:MSHA biogenesis protein MshM